jgi:hypothetical protein
MPSDIIFPLKLLSLAKNNQYIDNTIRTAHGLFFIILNNISEPNKYMIYNDIYILIKNKYLMKNIIDNNIIDSNIKNGIYNIVYINSLLDEEYINIMDKSEDEENLSIPCIKIIDFNNDELINRLNLNPKSNYIEELDIIKDAISNNLEYIVRYIEIKLVYQFLINIKIKLSGDIAFIKRKNNNTIVSDNNRYFISDAKHDLAVTENLIRYKKFSDEMYNDSNDESATLNKLLYDLSVLYYNVKMNINDTRLKNIIYN